jgi:hypothetical protein
VCFAGTAKKTRQIKKLKEIFVAGGIESKWRGRERDKDKKIYI